jgi:hypothetical protein
MKTFVHILFLLLTSKVVVEAQPAFTAYDEMKVSQAPGVDAKPSTSYTSQLQNACI